MQEQGLRFTTETQRHREGTGSFLINHEIDTRFFLTWIICFI